MSLHALFCPGILETNSLVEYGMLGRAVGVSHKVADTLELQILASLLSGGIVLDVAVVMYMERVGVEQLVEVALIGRRVLYEEEAVVLANLGLLAVVGAHPV